MLLAMPLSDRTLCSFDSSLYIRLFVHLYLYPSVPTYGTVFGHKYQCGCLVSISLFVRGSSLHNDVLAQTKGPKGQEDHAEQEGTTHF